MRINNPKSLAGFSRNVESDEASYKLATVGQLESAIIDINNKFVDLLTGKGVNGAPINLQGITNKRGYAWLTENGTIDPRVLPPIAITNTHAIPQSAIAQYVLDTEPSSSTASDLVTDTRAADGTGETNTEFKLRYWLSQHVTEPEYASVQQGDIFIVSPATNETINAEICGSYILVESSSVNGLIFKKMAYESGNIVSINGHIPEANGMLSLPLSGILIANGTSNEDAIKLSNDIYEISSEDGYFKFNNEKYAKLSELTDEINKRAADDLFISGAFDDFVAETTDIIGKGVPGSSRDTSAPIYPQLMALRNDVDDNAKLLDNSRHHTDTYLNHIHNDVIYLANTLNNNVIELREYEFTWSAEEMQHYDASTPTRIVTTDGIGEEPLTVKVSSYDIWTHVFNPNFSNYADEKIIAVFDANGNKIEADITRANSNEWKVSINLDHIENSDGTNINSLTGVKMTLLVASSIKLILDETGMPTLMVVGGADAASRTPDATPSNQETTDNP